MQYQLTKLDKAVIEQLGYDEVCDEVLDTLRDVANHGAAGGFGGFTYYSDTCEFFDKNRSAIIELTKEMGESLGVDPVDMIKGFNCLKDLELDSIDLMRVLMGRNTKTNEADATQVKNALAWFALEETARKLTDN